MKIEAESAGLVACLCVTVLAAALRLPGLAAGLPLTRDADDVVVRQALGLEVQSESRAGARPRPGHRIWSLYPHLLARLVLHLPGDLTPEAAPDADLEAHLAAASRPHLKTRLVIAVLAILLAPLTWLLARRFLEPGASLFAALLVATSLLHVIYSRQARPHGALATFCLASVLASLWMLRSGSWRSCAAAGGCAALAVGTLHSGSSVLPALALAGLFTWRRHGRRALVRLSLPLVFVLASVRLFYPFLTAGSGPLGLDWESFWARRAWEESVLTGAGARRSLVYLWGFDPVLLLLCAAGALLGLAALARSGRRTFVGERGRELAVVLAFAVPYALAIALYRNTWARFLAPLVPFLACLAAFGGGRALELLARSFPALARRAGPIALGAALTLPTLAGARWAWLQTRPDTLTLATRWIEEHADRERDTVLVGLTASLALFPDQHSRRAVPPYARTPLQQYWASHSGDPSRGRGWRLPPLLDPSESSNPSQQSAEALRAVVDASGGDFAVLFAPGRNRPALGVAVEAVRDAGGERVARVSGNALDGPDAGFGRDPLLRRYRMFRVALTSSAMGPVVDIYSLP